MLYPRDSLHFFKCHPFLLTSSSWVSVFSATTSAFSLPHRLRHSDCSVCISLHFAQSATSSLSFACLYFYFYLFFPFFYDWRAKLPGNKKSGFSYSVLLQFQLSASASFLFSVGRFCDNDSCNIKEQLERDATFFFSLSVLGQR